MKCPVGANRYRLLCSRLRSSMKSPSGQVQRKQYEKATSGVKYNAYKTASKFAMAGSMEVYNDQQQDSLQIQTPYAHLLLGYFWSASGKSTFAFAEADIVEEKSNAGHDLMIPKNIVNASLTVNYFLPRKPNSEGL